MKKNTKLLLVAALVGTSFSAFATGCSLFGGEYALSSFAANTSEMTLVYEIGDTIDLSGIQLTATYSDEGTKNIELKDVKIFYNDQDITENLSVLTQSAGVKKLTLTYTDEYGTKSCEISITVQEEEVVLDSISEFNKPAFIAAYQAQIAAAANEDTAENESVFFKNAEQEYYKVGDDNAFKLTPKAASVDFESGAVTELINCTVNSTVKVKDGDEFVTLVKSNKAGETFVYEYKQGDTVLVTENAAKNEFDFAAEAVGKVFALSVLPDATVYSVSEDIDAIEFEVEVVDAYNVYNTKQLSVIDNSQRTSWTTYKAAAGITDVAENGIVLHATMALTVEDIPSDFYYTLADDYPVYYKDENGNSKTPEEWGMTRTFLKQKYDNYTTAQEDAGLELAGMEDYVLIYTRYIGESSTFNFYGNYFEVDASALPLVAAFAPDKDKDGNTLTESQTWYDTDFSNASLFMVVGKETRWTCGDCNEVTKHPTLKKCSSCGSTNVTTSYNTTENFHFNNLAVKGNAKSEQLIVDTDKTKNAKDDTLVRAGGLILTKVGCATATHDNVRTYNFFTTFIANRDSNIEYNHTKCYDSFQTAIFAYGNTNVTINNSYFKRAGGPLIIAWHVEADDSNSLAIPNIRVDANSIMDTSLTGSEVWFGTVGGGAIISRLRDQLDGLFNMAGKTLFENKLTDKDGGKMNIMALLMPEGTSADAALTTIQSQGMFYYDLDEAADAEDTTSPRLDRTMTTVPGVTLHQILLASQGQAPVINVGGQVFYYAGEEVGILDATNTPAAQAFGMAIASANYVGFTMGGLSIMFELFPLA